MNHEIPDQFDEPRTTTRDEHDSDRSGEALIYKCCADLGVNYAIAVQILSWADENLEARGQKPEARSPESAKLMAALIKILEYEYQHPGIIPAFAVRYVFNLPLLDDMIGHHNPASFAASLKPAVSREAVNKEVKAALKYFRLPPRRGMRQAEACANMSKARINQLMPEVGGQKAD